MAYRRDENLEFLKHCSDEDLSPLVELLTKSSSGSERLTEELTMHERYKEHQPNHQQYWDLIAAEIQCFGANTWATLGRGGKGVLYREILIDVCKRLKVKTDIDHSVFEIERELLLKLSVDAIERMSPEERADAIRELEIETEDLTKQAVIVAIQSAARSGGFFTYRMSLIVANAVAKKVFGTGLSFAANVGLVRGVSVFTGPIGWILAAAWTAFDLAGPAFRVTQPAVIFVAVLRLRHEMAKDANRGKPEQTDPSTRQHVVVVEDGRVSEMEAVLRRVKQKEIQVLSSSQGTHLKFGEEIVPNTLYTIHPRTRAVYFRQAAIGQRLFEEQVIEAADLLQAMGAKHVRIESERALSGMKAVEGGVKSKPLALEAHGEVEASNNKRFLYEVKRPARNDDIPIDESMLKRSVWYRSDPFFEQLLDDYARGELDEINCEREYEEESLISGNLDFEVLETVGISIGGKSKEHQAVKFSVFARFGEPQ